jgi:hypothetical protein
MFLARFPIRLRNRRHLSPILAADADQGTMESIKVTVAEAEKNLIDHRLKVANKQ